MALPGSRKARLLPPWVVASVTYPGCPVPNLLIWSNGLPNGPTASAASSGTRPTRLWLLENKNLIAFGERSGDAGDSLHRYEEDIAFLDGFRFTTSVLGGNRALSTAELDYNKRAINSLMPPTFSTPGTSGAAQTGSNCSASAGGRYQRSGSSPSDWVKLPHDLAADFQVILARPPANSVSGFASIIGNLAGLIFECSRAKEVGWRIASACISEVRVDSNDSTTVPCWRTTQSWCNLSLLCTSTSDTARNGI